MKLLIIEPYFTGSHAAWAKGYQESSQWEISLLTLPGNFWKWRMHGGALTLARKFLEGKFRPDAILASDMLDLSTFQALTRKKTAKIPFFVYFHENQLTYPWSSRDRDFQAGRDMHFGFINVTSALASDFNFFNSHYHLESFISSLPSFLKQFPDHNELETVEIISSKSQVLPLGLKLKVFDEFQTKTDEFKKEKNITKPLILWNHRWEYDKNPEEFFKLLEILHDKGHDFQLAILGEKFRKEPKEFLRAQKIFSEKIRHWGYAPNREEYAKWLWASDLAPVTSNQEFFGASFLEASFCNCTPLLPKRLTYPELIPQELHPSFLYENFDDLVEKTIHFLERPPQKDLKKLRKAVEPFDWEDLAPHYDKTLSTFIQKLF